MIKIYEFAEMKQSTLSFINGERSHTAVNRKPPTGRDIKVAEEEDNEKYSNSRKCGTIVENTNSCQYSGNTNDKKNSGNYNQFHIQQTQCDNIFESTKNQQHVNQSNKENIYCGNHNIKRNTKLLDELKKDALFQKQKYKLLSSPLLQEMEECTIRQGGNADNGLLRFEVNTVNHLEACGAGLGGRVKLVVSGSPCNECCSGGADIPEQQPATANVETLGFRPIHPIGPRSDAYETVTQQPQFWYANSKSNENCSCRCGNHQNQQHENSHHLQHTRSHHHQCKHTGPAVGIVTLPNFEQAFGHLLGRPTTEFCGICYDNYAPFYDSTQYAADTTRTASVVSTTVADIEEAKNPYKKSLDCCTPAVCDTIFKSLRKPNASSDNNLIYNIPFTTETPDTTTTSISATTPRKTRFDLPQKTSKAYSNRANGSNNSGGGTSNANSPYRTLSHFGFNSPQRDPQPDHKHIPCTTEPKKYVPLRKSISYEEIFSSPRYVGLCEYCFEKIVRLKPEFAQQTQTRLRNIYDYNGPTKSFGADVPTVGVSPGIMYQPTCSESNAYDYVEYASSDTTEESLPPFPTTQLEPVLEEVEEVEPDSNEDATKKALPPPDSQQVARTPSNSSFIEKIMRLNYSEESADWNFAQSPHRVVSCTNLTLELDHAIMEESQREQQELHTTADQQVETILYNIEKESDLRASNIGEGAVSSHDVKLQHRMSVTEIWEFMHWQNADEEGACTTNPQYAEFEKAGYPCIHQSSSQGNGAVCLYYENTRENATNKLRTLETNALHDTQDDRNSMESDSTIPPEPAAASDDSGTLEHRRLLMTREERGRRKLVFQELWEDHISFLDGKELNSLSDTESAIDGLHEESSASALCSFENTLVARGLSESCFSAGREQDVTKKGSISPGLIIPLDECQTSTSAKQLLEAEVFNSRSFILRNCASGTAMFENNDGDAFDQAAKSDSSMKLQTTEVRPLSLHGLGWSLRDHNARLNVRSKGTSESKPEYSAAESSENKNIADVEYVEMEQQMKDTCIEELKTPITATSMYKASAEASTTPTLNFERITSKHGFNKPNSQEDCAPSMHSFSVKNAMIYAKPKEELVGNTETNQTLKLRNKRSLHSTCSRVELNRPPTPKPPAFISKIRILSSLETQPILIESALKSNQKRGSLDCAVSSSESDDNQSARTYDLGTSRECIFFRQHEMDNTAVITSPRRVDCEGNDISCMMHDSKRSRDLIEKVETCSRHENTNTISRQGKQAEKVEVNDILINKLKAPTMERSKAGMALPKNNPNTKSDHKSAPRNETNAARVAQLTAEAIREPPCKVYNSSRLTKPSYKKPTVSLTASYSNGASTSAQAAQTRTNIKLELMSEPKVDQYELYEQSLSTPISPVHVSVTDDWGRKAEDYVNPFETDVDEMQFAELLESDEHEDLTKLSEEFEELIFNVENLQLQAQTREHGGAETHGAMRKVEEDSIDVGEEHDNETIRHLNPMERKILRKIRENQLKDCEEIFDKIEMTIRNKVTPAQLEKLVREQWLGDTIKITHGVNESQSPNNSFATSTPDKFLSPLSNIANESDSVGRSFTHENISVRSEARASEIAQAQMDAFTKHVLGTNSNCLIDNDILDADDSLTHTPRGSDKFFSPLSNLANESDSVGRSFTHEKISVRSEARASQMAQAQMDAFTKHVLETNSNCLIDNDILDADNSLTHTPRSSRNYSCQSGKSKSNAKDESTTGTQLRRSRSLTPLDNAKRHELSPPIAKLNKTTTPPHQEVRASLGNPQRDSKKAQISAYRTKVSGRTISKWPRASSSTPEMKTSKRNFILENIRNAAIPRHNGATGLSPGRTGAVGLVCGAKHLQGNAQAIFCKNPFGPLSASRSGSKASNSSLSSSTTGSNQTIVKSSSSSTQISRQLSPRNSSTGVYTFQSKLVRGSPRFWVSLTQPNVKKLQTQKRLRCSNQQNNLHPEANDPTCSLREFLHKENEEDMKLKEVELHAEQMAQTELEILHKSCGRGRHEELENKEDNELYIATKKWATEESVEAYDFLGNVRAESTPDNIPVTEQNTGEGFTGAGGGGGVGVEHELIALGKQIQQLEPHLDTYQNKMHEFDKHVTRCTHHMDDFVAVQDDIVESHRQLREEIELQQYAENIMYQVQTYSISETED